MMTRTALPVALVALSLLSACGDPAPPPAPTNTATSESGYIARVRALPEGQKRGVLFRAIRDSGQGCPQMTSFAQIADQGGRPAWDATCSDGGRWRIVLADDGTAQVTGSGPR